jgi:ribonuclease T2
MRFLAFLAALILAAQMLPQAARAGDAHILALSWQPAFCETAERRPECREQTKDRADARQFSLHGLWPQPASHNYCGVADTVVEDDKSGRWHKLPIDYLPQELWNRLRIAMPGTRSGLHKHEWIKHGTCAAGNAQTYYARSLALVDAVNHSAVARLFAANIGKTLSADAIRASFDTDFGAGAGRRVKLSCVEHGGRRLIVEITIGLDGTLSDSPDIAALIAAAPPTDPGCPGGIVDPAGLQ